jgi:hypothetical protein
MVACPRNQAKTRQVRHLRLACRLFYLLSLLHAIRAYFQGIPSAYEGSPYLLPFVAAQLWKGGARSHRRHQTNEFHQNLRMIPYARFPIRTTFPSLLGTRDTTAALARSSKAVAMYFA